MSNNLEIKQGTDKVILLPITETNNETGETTPIDLTGAYVYFQVYSADGETLLVAKDNDPGGINAGITIRPQVDPTIGHVEVALHHSDFAAVDADAGPFPFAVLVREDPTGVDTRSKPSCGHIELEACSVTIDPTDPPVGGTSPASQTVRLRSFKFTTPDLGDSFTVPIPDDGMLDANYCIEAHLEDRNGGPGVVFETPTAGRTATQFQLECSGSLFAGAVINFILRDA